MATTYDLENGFVDLGDPSAAAETMVTLAKPLSKGSLPESVRTNEIVQAIMNAGIHTLSAGENPWNNFKNMK